MKIIKTEIEDALIIEPDVYRDERGFFLESYNYQRYCQHGITHKFIQDNHSKSVKNTLRGLHAQKPPFAQTKLVRAVKGTIIDVAVDIRGISDPKDARWIAVELSEDNFRQLLIPQGFLHGFFVLSETAEVQYKCDNPYNKQSEVTIKWNDPDIGIDWPTNAPIISPRDNEAPLLKDILKDTQ